MTRELTPQQAAQVAGAFMGPNGDLVMAGQVILDVLDGTADGARGWAWAPLRGSQHVDPQWTRQQNLSRLETAVWARNVARRNPGSISPAKLEIFEKRVCATWRVLSLPDGGAPEVRAWVLEVVK